jgi:hypothetical protein
MIEILHRRCLFFLFHSKLWAKYANLQLFAFFLWIIWERQNIIISAWFLLNQVFMPHVLIFFLFIVLNSLFGPKHRIFWILLEFFMLSYLNKIFVQWVLSILLGWLADLIHQRHSLSNDFRVMLRLRSLSSSSKFWNSLGIKNSAWKFLSREFWLGDLLKLSGNY